MKNYFTGFTCIRKIKNLFLGAYISCKYDKYFVFERRWIVFKIGTRRGVQTIKVASVLIKRLQRSECRLFDTSSFRLNAGVLSGKGIKRFTKNIPLQKFPDRVCPVCVNRLYIVKRVIWKNDNICHALIPVKYRHTRL